MTDAPAPLSVPDRPDQGREAPATNTGFRLRALADWCEAQHTSPTPADLRALAALADWWAADTEDTAALDAGPREYCRGIGAEHTCTDACEPPLDAGPRTDPGDMP